MDSKIPKITYLFGAGASAQKLPTIKGLPDRIKFVQKYIETNYLFEDDELYESHSFTFKKNEAKEYVLAGFDKLYIASQNHSTIDTFAKKLAITNRAIEAHELTFFLSLYFNIEQKIKGHDLRYDTFLISILNYSAEDFPGNLKFLSWNYDLQFEIAYEHLIEKNHQLLDFRRFNTMERGWEKDSFTSIKINGSCNVIESNSKRLFTLTENILNFDPLNDDIAWAFKFAYLKFKRRYTAIGADVNIDFAWYKNTNFIDNVAELHNETNVLVVIGYSFPFFNREVDRKIIRSMPNLKKIYVQDILPEGIITRFLSILPDWKNRNIEIIPVNEVSEFFLPPEL